MKKQIGLLVSHYMGAYLPYLAELCNKNNIQIDLFCFDEYDPQFNYRKKYILKSKYNPKKFYTVKNIENEIMQLVNVEEYDYFVCDCVCLSFKNACNIFHGHTTNYKIDHTTSGISKIIHKIGHFNIIQNEAKQYQNSKLCIVGSKEMKKDFNQNCNIPFCNIKIIYPGFNELVNDNSIKKEYNHAFVIGSVTCGFYFKGGYTVLKALNKLKKEYSPEQLKCKFINPNYNRQWQLKLYVKILGLSKYVEFLPYYKNISNFYKKLDCLICASKAEAFGRVVPEAMMSNVPVIAASHVGAADIIQNGINGYIFVNDKNKVENLALTIKKVMANEDINFELFKNAKETASKITWKNFGIQLFNEMFMREMV